MRRWPALLARLLLLLGLVGPLLQVSDGGRQIFLRGRGPPASSSLGPIRCDLRLALGLVRRVPAALEAGCAARPITPIPT